MKALSEQTHYEVLELAPGASAEALARAYAKAKEAYGPGSLATYALAEPSEAEAVLKRVDEAYAVLSDAEQRRTYDAAHGFLAAPVAPVETPVTEPPKIDPPKEETPAEPPKPEPPQEEPPKEEPPTEEPPKVEPSTPEPAKVEAQTDLQASQPTQPPGVSESSLAPKGDFKPEITEPNLVIPTPPPPSSSSPTDPSGFAPGIAPAVPTPPPPPTAVTAALPTPLAASPTAPIDAAPEPKTPPVASSLSPPPPQNVSGVDKPVRKTEAELAPDGPVTGEALKRVREARGLSLKDLEARTKIGHWHLDSIEKERYAGLPAHVYLRGFLMSLARELKLDPVRVSKSYLEQMKAKQAEKAEKP